MRYFKLAICLSLMVVFLAASAILASAKVSVKVFHVSGTAEYLRAGAPGWKKITVGTELYSGDSVKTYRNASVEIAFDDRKKNVVSIEANTHAVLKLGKREKIELVDGEVFSLVKRLPVGSRFEIRTPTAVCGARGTGWRAKADKNETTVSAYEKDSYAMGITKDGTLTEESIVKEGYETVVKRFDKPSKLMKISDKNMERWDGWKDDLIERVSARRTTRERLGRDLDRIQGQKEKIEDLGDADRISKRIEDSGAGAGAETKSTAE